ncbi:MAG: hypothetical protein HY776_00510 [Actinobacteria bacterium]|nr:hypothetical protein [Actinomycetota bacterium]
MKNNLRNFINKWVTAWQKYRLQILVGISFLAGLKLGYILGFFRVHNYLSINFLEININLTWFSKITPNPTFLSDVAAFEAIIIAFLVPLSIEIISKISERYNSDVITRVFESGLWNKTLPPFLLINIVAAILLRFLVKDNADSLIWKITAWIVMLMFLYIAFAIWRMILRIKAFMGDTKHIVNQLNKDVNKSLE